MPGGFEHDIRQYLNGKTIRFEDHTGSLDALDFSLPNCDLHFDVKEKKQHFNVANWVGADIPEEFFFIVDDLAARKILLKSPRSFMLIRDDTQTPAVYYVFSIVDLLCMPKKRVRRKLEKSAEAYKGKWYVDLRHGARFESLEKAFDYMIEYTGKFSQIFREHIDCWGDYTGENIPTAGTPRTSGYWTKDLKSK